MQDDPPRTASEFQPSRVPEARPGPEGGARHVNRLARTRTLVDGALQCFLQHGLDGTTIDDVVNRASMAKGSFYRYFTNKEDLVAALFQPLGERVVAAMERCAATIAVARDASTLEDAYRALAGELVAALLDGPELVRLFLQERHGPPSPARAPVIALDRAIREHAVQMAVAGRAHGLLRPFDAHLSAMVVVGAVHELLWEQFAGRGSENPIAGATDLVEIVLRGVRQP